MRQTILAVFLCCLSAPVLACPPPPERHAVTLAGDEARAAEVWSTFEGWLDAYARGDLEPVMAIFAPDVAFSFQGVPDQSNAALRAAYVDDFRMRKPGVSWRPRVDEVHADGNLAFVRATWERVTVGADGAPHVDERNRSLDVLRREADGRWVIFRSMNYPEKQ